VNQSALVRRDSEILEVMRRSLFSAALNQHVNFVETVRVGSAEIPRKYRHVGGAWITHMVAAPEGHCPDLAGVVTVPYLSPAGRLVTCPGYDQETQLWLHWEGPAADPNAVNDGQMWSVVQRLWDSPFLTPSDKLHALGLYLLPLLRPAIQECTPMHLLHAERHDRGKSYTLEILGAIARGRTPTMHSLSENKVEAEYQLYGYLSTSPWALCFDNLTSDGILGSPEFHRMLTAKGSVDVRLPRRGTPTTVTPRCLWVATQNRPDVHEEMCRRTIPVGLGEPPEEWFTPDLHLWIVKNRWLVVSCLLRLIAAWLDAGRPTPPRTLSSFEEWSDVVGGVVCQAFPQAAADWLHPDHRPTPKVEMEWKILFDSWPTGESGPKVAPAKMILQWLDDSDLDAVRALVSGRNERGRLTSIGRLFSRMAAARTHHGGYRLVKLGSGNNAAYRPVRAEG